MEDNNLPVVKPKSFEELRQINEYGAEYWSARDLQTSLGYNTMAKIRERHHKGDNILRAVRK